MAINGHDSWINQMVEGVNRESFLQDMVAFHDTGLANIKECSSSGGESVRPSVDGAVRAVPLEGRSALGVKEDSNGEELAEATKKPSSPKAARNALEFQTIEIEDMQIVVQRRQRGRGFVVPLEGDSLVNTLGFSVQQGFE